MAGADRMVLAVSDPAELASLAGWLGSVPVQVERTAGVPGPGEQGALDVLTVLAGSGGLIAAVKMLPEFLRARRAGVTVTVEVDGRRVTVDATNVTDVMPVLERVLGERNGG